MRLPSLNRRLSMQRKRKRRRQIQARYGSVAVVPDQKDSLCQEDHSQDCERSTYSGPNLPEDIWCHIHALMPLCDSARSACVSHTFLYSWRCRPKLIFTEETLGLEQKKGRKSDIARAFTSRVDHILRSHSSTGVKTLEFVIPDCYNVSTWQLNSWLRKAVTPGIEEVTLSLPSKYRAKYNFPCSILFDGRGNSIRFLDLTDCTFRPTVGFDCLRSLTKLRLHRVRITGDELGCLLSNCFALEKLELRYCHELICLKIPFLLESLSCLSVAECSMLQVIESTAPNLSNFDFLGEPVQLSLGASSKVKNVNLGFLDERNSISYAITKLPSIVPHLETLTICPSYERGKTPMVAYKFFHLKYLMIDLIPDDDGDGSPAYDYLSLASFLYASPVLETFILSVDQYDMEHDSVFGDASPMRQIPDHKHDRLKKVEINGFCSAKSMVELTCHILENATSLESVTLDGICGEYEDGSTVRCKKIGKCKLLSKHMILEAHKALSVVKRYILGRVPSTVKLNVREPCSRCHTIDVK